MKRLTIFLALLITSAAPAQEVLPVPFGDLYECLLDECADLTQIVSDVAHAYWEGRPIELGPDDPVEDVDALLWCLDDPVHVPPHYNGPCVWDELTAMRATLLEQFPFP